VERPIVVRRVTAAVAVVAFVIAALYLARWLADSL